MATVRERFHEQDGVIRRDQAVACGMSIATVDRRLAAREWIPVHPRVYRESDRELSERGRVRAGALWAGDGATVVGMAAASWWHMTSEAVDDVRLAVGPEGGHTTPAGLVATRRAVTDRVLVDGLWVPRRGEAALDAAVELGLVDGARLIDRALQDDKVSVETLRQALAARGPRHGTVLARRLVGLADGGARFEAERRAHGVLRAAGISGGVPNLAVSLPGWGNVVIDIAFREKRVAIEVDGWAYHHDIEQFRRDRLRRNELTVAGWLVLQVTWYELVNDPERFVASVHRALTLADVA